MEIGTLEMRERRVGFKHIRSVKRIGSEREEQSETPERSEREEKRGLSGESLCVRPVCIFIFYKNWLSERGMEVYILRTGGVFPDCRVFDEGGFTFVAPRFYGIPLGASYLFAGIAIPRFVVPVMQQTTF